MIDKLINAAKNELAYTENPPNSNKTKYGEEYGLNGYSWCMIFLWWIFKKAGMSDFLYNGQKISSCTSLKEYSEKNGQWITGGQYKPGDIAIMTFSKSKEIQHCGLIIENNGRGYYTTIEGNTSPGKEGSQDNGGCVALKQRHTNNILGVCRPNYEEEEMTDEKFAEYMERYLINLSNQKAPAWAEKELQEAVRAGITDGARPMQLIPRYQAAIMALRAGKRRK